MTSPPPPSETAASAGVAPATVSAWAPGRVNLIGEHTDYQGGFVLPMALERGTRVELRTREDQTVHVSSDARAGVIAYEVGAEAPAGDWADYVRGVTSVVAGAGYAIGGFEARLTTDLPVGSGLSSSAALEIAVLRALRRAFDLVMDDVTLAQLGRRAESEFVGVPTGIMDQMVCSLGAPGRPFLLDTRSLSWQSIALPPSRRVLVIDPRLPHENAQSGYRERRREAEEAARLLGVGELRELTEHDLPRIARLPGVLARRARHIVTENARVLAFYAALARDDGEQLGALLAASHRSLRDDYQVSLPAIDVLVQICEATPGVVGARLTGGGFGGAVVVLADAALALTAAQSIVATYGHGATVVDDAASPAGSAH